MFLQKMLLMGIPFMYTLNAEKVKWTGLLKMTEELWLLWMLWFANLPICLGFSLEQSCILMLTPLWCNSTMENLISFSLSLRLITVTSTVTYWDSVFFFTSTMKLSVVVAVWQYSTSRALFHLASSLRTSINLQTAQKVSLYC